MNWFEIGWTIDLCVDFGGFPLTLDTEQGQAEKTSGDRTLAIIPVSRTYPIAELNIESPWIKIRNVGNLSTLGFKLFSDLGLYLSAKLTETPTDLPDQLTNAGYTTSGSYTQQITLSFASAPVGVSRGNEIYNRGFLKNFLRICYAYCFLRNLRPIFTHRNPGVKSPCIAPSALPGLPRAPELSIDANTSWCVCAVGAVGLWQLANCSLLPRLR